VKAVLVISDRDNVATALEALDAGRSIQIGERTLRTCESIPAGHKVALIDIAVGQPVIKYGSPIGLAIALIHEGSHVHTHNVASGRGRGDLHAAQASAEPGVRLAEPADTGEPSAPVVTGEPADV
jgi:altronate dehydratase